MIKSLKWNKTFHGCPMLQSANNKKEREREFRLNCRAYFTRREVVIKHAIKFPVFPKPDTSSNKIFSTLDLSLFSSAHFTLHFSRYLIWFYSLKSSRDSQARKMFLFSQCVFYFTVISSSSGTRGNVVGWGTMLQAGWSRVRVPMKWIFFNLPNPSNRTMALV
jgi:hypothetical protein